MPGWGVLSQCNFAARVLHVRACMSVSEKFHFVYSAVEKERKGKGGLSHTFPHVRLEEKGAQLFTARSPLRHTHICHVIYADSFAKCFTVKGSRST